MPQELRDMEKERHKYEEKKAAALELRQRKEDGSAHSFPPAIDLTDSAMTVLQANSAHDDWENTAMMGAHPGMMFGCHCSAQLEMGDYDAVYGPVGYPTSLDFARRYPKSKGRQTLPNIMQDQPDLKAPWEVGISVDQL